MKRVRLAVVGAGLIGRQHVAAIAAASTATLAALIDPDPGAQALAQRAGVPWYADLDAMLAHGGVDGAILATPNQLHVAGGLACVAAGLPVLVENPFAADVASGRRLVEAAEAAGVALLTGHHRRHNPLIAAAKAMLDAGAIGTPVAVQGMFWLIKPDGYFAPDWRRAPGAGPVFLNLIHDVDLMRHLVGEIKAVQAVSSNAIRGNAVEDVAVILLEFVGGALGTMNVCDAIPAPWSWELTAGENPAYPRTDQACYMIGGSHGALELPSLRLWHQTGPRDWWQPLCTRIAPHPAGDPLLRQIEQFAAVIRGQEVPLVSGAEGLRSLAVIEAIKTAANTGHRVMVEI